MVHAKATIKKRIGLIDETRGLAIILMVVYHLVYDLVALYGINIPLFVSPQMNMIRDIFAGLFIFISGSACRLSRNNLKRGCICFGFGMLLTLVTWLFIPKELICFGILHMLGISMILFHLLRPALDKLKFPIIGIFLCAVLFYTTMNITSGKIGPFLLPEAIMNQNWLFPFGIAAPGFYSSDYFPLLPWVFIFFAGSYFGVYLKDHRLPEFFYNVHLRPLAFVGRHTLIVYLLHQPIVYGILFLIFQYIIPWMHLIGLL